VRIAQDALLQELLVAADLRLRVQAAARVVEVDVAEAIEARVIGGAQLVDRHGGGEGGEPPQEVLIREGNLRWRL